MAAQDDILRAQLVDRRHRLETAAQRMPAAYVSDLLREVDSALARMEAGAYGLCETCHDPIEPERLMANPLARFCLDHLTPEQQRALEQDLEMAARIQAGLLPGRSVVHGPWELCHHYEAVGPVSGDYCDVVTADGDSGAVFFMLGDVSGKGVAASMLMSQLHAIFRSLIAVGLSVNQLMERANRVFCETTMPQHFATLVCGQLSPTGEVELCNAGHCPPLLIRRTGVTTIGASGLPLGVFSNSVHGSERARLEPGETLFLYTDGLSEATDGSGAEYGAAQLSSILTRCQQIGPGELIRACLDDLSGFLAGARKSDDLTVMAIRRAR